MLPRTAYHVYPKIRKRREWCRVPRVVNRCCCIAVPSACPPTGKHTRRWHVLPGQDVLRLAPKNSELLGRHRRLWGASASGCTRTASHPFTISGCAPYIFMQDPLQDLPYHLEIGLNSKSQFSCRNIAKETNVFVANIYNLYLIKLINYFIF